MLNQGINDRSLDKATRLYFKDLQNSPLLTAEEEKALARRARNGDKFAEQRLIESNLRFVIKVAKQFRKSGLPLLELINEGNIGLIEAARRFDPDREVRFVSYAVWWIRQSILLYISRAALAFRISSRTANILYRVSRVYARVAQSEEVSEELIARESGVSVEELRNTFKAVAGVISLDHPVHEGDERNFSEVVNQVSRESADEPASELQLKRQIDRSLALLSEKERTVLRLRFGLDDDDQLTLQEIGERLSLSRERIRQLEASALRKVRTSPRSQDLLMYLN